MSWILEAIEKEADCRATERLIENGPENFTFKGLSTEKLNHLIVFYEVLTGRKAHEILEDISKNQEIVSQFRKFKNA